MYTISIEQTCTFFSCLNGMQHVFVSGWQSSPMNLGLWSTEIRVQKEIYTKLLTQEFCRDFALRYRWQNGELLSQIVKLTPVKALYMSDSSFIVEWSSLLRLLFWNQMNSLTTLDHFIVCCFEQGNIFWHRSCFWVLLLLIISYN